MLDWKPMTLGVHTSLDAGGCYEVWYDGKEWNGLRYIANGTLEWRTTGTLQACMRACEVHAGEKIAADEFLREVYRQAGNAAPANRRHALTPGLRDSIRDHLLSNGGL